MPVSKQPSFTGGEIAPSLQSRTDLERYHVALAEAYNVFIHAHGGVSNCSGTKFVGEVEDSTKQSRLYPFEFNTEQTYILEFADLKLRVIKDGSYVLDGANIYEEVSPYAVEDLDLLKFVQSADVLTITHPNYKPYKLSRLDHDNWSFDIITFTATPTVPSSGIPFQSTGDYPRATTYFEQRQVFGGTINKPDSTWLSQTGDYPNFGITSPQVSSDAIEAGIPARKVNEIRHFVPMNDLIVLTSGSEFKISSGDSGIAFDTIRQKPQSYYGCSNVPPLVIGYEVLFVQARGSLVRNLGYSLERDGYSGTNLSIMANHLFEGHQIKEWSYAQIPDSVIYAVRDDGKLLMLTYLPEQEVWGWSLGETDGYYESVASIPEGEEDSVYFIVKRTINGSDVRHVERMSTREFADVRDSFFVHDGLSYDNPIDITGITKANPAVVTAVAHGFDNGDTVDIFDVEGMTKLNTRRFTVANKTVDTFELSGEDSTEYDTYTRNGTVRKAIKTVSGLDHLEGKMVSCLCDGNVISNKTVESGSVTFSRAFSRIHIGLPYSSRIKTLNVDFSNGALNGKKRRIPSCYIEMENTRGLKAGIPDKELSEIKDRRFEAIGDPTELFTGSKHITFNSQWDRSGQVVIQQDNPLPMTITAVLPEVEVGG